MRYPLATSGRWVGLAVLMLALTAPALAQRTVTLRLNTATLPDTTLPSIFNATTPGANIQVRGNVGDGGNGTDTLPDGNMIDWNDNTTLRPTNDGGDYWSINFQIPDNEQLDFKFYSTQAAAAGLEGWETGGNHAIPAGTGDIALDLHYFEFSSDQAYDWRPFSAEGDSIAVWLRVYMNTVNAGTKGYVADDAGLMVGARGNFGTLGAVDADGPVVDWGEGGDTDQGVRLTRESDDATKPGYNLFSGLVKYPASAAGMNASYKFYFLDSNNTGDGGYEDADNRSLTLPAASADTTIHWVYYSNSPPLEGTLITSNVTFQVDVSPLTSIGLFQTGEDQVEVRGGFNGWDCPADNQDDCLLSQIPGTARFANQFPVQSLPGTEQAFKYYLNLQPPFTDPGGNVLDIGWEEPMDYGGGNRPFVFAGTPEQDNGVQFFNNIRPDNVIADGQSIDVTFSVDMAAAVDFQTDAFDPATDSVSVRFEDNVWLLTQGYEPGSGDLIDVGDGNAIPGFKLTDPDGDLVYTGVLTVTGPTYNGIAYNHFYSSTQRSGIVVEGAGGFDEGRRRYRYIMDRTASSFAFAQDAFKDPSDPTAFTPWEINPTGPFTPSDFMHAIANGQADVFVANEQGPGIARGVTLSAPRPNPAAGAVRFDLGLENAQDVRVQVIDLTGRTVATLAQGYQTAGETELTFDASGLAAGMYIVRVEAAGQVVSRRMTVVR